MPSCPTCGKETETVAGKRQHHTKVHGEPLPNRTCTRCGECFYDENAERKRCEDCKDLTGKTNPNWSGSKEISECRNCGEAFEFYPSNKKGLYCPSCVSNGEVRWGEDNLEPFEGDGESEYGSEWRRISSKVRRRDNHTCQMCGVAQEEYRLEQALDVHHIKPIREFNNPKDAHTLDNLVTLCRKCHHEVEVRGKEAPQCGSNPTGLLSS